MVVIFLFDIFSVAAVAICIFVVVSVLLCAAWVCSVVLDVCSSSCVWSS